MFHLPKLNYIEIRNYNLYKCPLRIDFSKPLCIVYGTNGTGKSTLLQIILFSIIGPYKEGLKTTTRNYIRRDSRPCYPDRFFSARVLNDSSEEAVVEVSFTINSHSVLVIHSLETCMLIKAVIDADLIEGESIEYKKYEQIYASDPNNKKLKLYNIWHYQQKVAELTGLPGGFNTLISMFTDVMFFDEGRHYTFWKSSTQEIIIGKYILDTNSYEDYLEIKRTTKHLESVYKKRSETLNYMHNFLKKEKEKLEKKTETAIDTRLKIVSIQEDIDNLKLDIEQLQDSFLSKRKEYMQKYDEIKRKEAELKGFDNDWDKSFFTPTYNSFFQDNYLIMKKGICPACGQDHNFGDLPEDKCILCGALLNKENCDDILSLDMKIKTLHNELVRLHKEKDELDLEIEDIKTNVDKKKNEIEQLEVNKYSLEILTKPESDPISIRDQQRLNVAQQERAEALRILTENKKLEEEKSKNLEMQFVQRFGEYRSSFLKFASAFYGDLHSIDLYMPFREENTLTDAMMHFKLDGQERLDSYQLSESQRIFTDLAFRFSVLSCYHKYSFFVFETPDSTLDIYHEENAKKTLEAYIKEGNTLIISVNARKSTLVADMLKDLDETDVSVIDLTLISSLSSNINTMTFDEYVK